MRIQQIVAAIGLCGAFLVAHANTFTWPGSAPCDTTLTACANSSVVQDSDTIVLAPSGLIDESLTIYKAVSFTPAPGNSPTFGAGNFLYELSEAGSGSTTSIQGLTFLDGYVFIHGVDHVSVTRTTVNTVTGGGYYFGIQAIDASDFALSGNKVVIDVGLNQPAILVGTESIPTSSGSIHDNRVFSDANSFVSFQGRVGTVKIYGNNVYNGEIDAVNTAMSGGGNLEIVNNAVHCGPFRDDNFASGIDAFSTTPTHMDIVNNTIVGCQDGVDFFGPTSGGQLTNNIIANNGIGVNVQDATTFHLSNGHNLLWANGANNHFTPDTSTITDDPLFVRGSDNARLTDGSPAIDTADTTALTQLLTAQSIPAIDADGSRRFKGAAGSVDIGAFEYGDMSFVQAATAGETDIPKSLLTADDMPQLVQNFTPDTYISRQLQNGYTGFETVGNSKKLVAEGTGSSPDAGATFNVFAPADGDGRFDFTTDASNVDQFAAVIDDAYTNDHPERIVMATLDSSTLFNHPHATVYSDKRWHIAQLDAQPGDPNFASGVTFNVYAQDPSINAFHFTVPVTHSTFALDHPLLNGEPCARVFIGNASSHPHPLYLNYFFGQWYVSDETDDVFVAGTQLPVVIDEAGTQACRYDHLFHNDFELDID